MFSKFTWDLFLGISFLWYQIWTLSQWHNNFYKVQFDFPSKSSETEKRKPVTRFDTFFRDFLQSPKVDYCNWVTTRWDRTSIAVVGRFRGDLDLLDVRSCSSNCNRTYKRTLQQCLRHGALSNAITSVALWCDAGFALWTSTARASSFCGAYDFVELEGFCTRSSWANWWSRCRQPNRTRAAVLQTILPHPFTLPLLKNWHCPLSFCYLHLDCLITCRNKTICRTCLPHYVWVCVVILQGNKFLSIF